MFEGALADTMAANQARTTHQLASGPALWEVYLAALRSRASVDLPILPLGWNLVEPSPLLAALLSLRRKLPRLMFLRFFEVVVLSVCRSGASPCSSASCHARTHVRPLTTSTQRTAPQPHSTAAPFSFWDKGSMRKHARTCSRPARTSSRLGVTCPPHC